MLLFEFFIIILLEKENCQSRTDIERNLLILLSSPIGDFFWQHSKPLFSKDHALNLHSSDDHVIWYRHILLNVCLFCLLHFVPKLRQKITMQNTLYVFFLFPFFFLSLSSLSPFPNFILSTETKLQKLLPTSIFVYLCFQITFFFFSVS